jgi:hypothetical protein
MGTGATIAHRPEMKKIPSEIGGETRLASDAAKKQIPFAARHF